MYADSLCNTCQFKKVTRNKRGSEFWLCLKSKEDERFRKYPPQPVGWCRGHKEHSEK